MTLAGLGPSMPIPRMQGMEQFGGPSYSPQPTGAAPAAPGVAVPGAQVPQQQAFAAAGYVPQFTGAGYTPQMTGGRSSHVPLALALVEALRCMLLVIHAIHVHGLCKLPLHARLCSRKEGSLICLTHLRPMCMQGRAHGHQPHQQTWPAMQLPSPSWMQTGTGWCRVRTASATSCSGEHILMKAPPCLLLLHGSWGSHATPWPSCRETHCQGSRVTKQHMHPAAQQLRDTASPMALPQWAAQNMCHAGCMHTYSIMQGPGQGGAAAHASCCSWDLRACWPGLA